jgi:CheY-like chemotaxis protein
VQQCAASFLYPGGIRAVMREYLDCPRAGETIDREMRTPPEEELGMRDRVGSPAELHHARRPCAGGTPWPTTNQLRTLRLMLRVALLDDHPAVLAGLRRLIDSEPDLTVAGAASSATNLARELDGVRPDVVVLDHDLARDDGLSHCRRIKSRPQPPAVIIYSAYAGPALTLAARAAQADGVVDKTGPVPALLAAVRGVANGEVVMSPVPRDVFEAAVAVSAR